VRGRISHGWPTLRDEGVGAFVAKALDTTFFSRLALFALAVGVAPPRPVLGAGVTARFLGEDELEVLDRERPGAATSARVRAARGDRCFAVTVDGQIRGTRWIARGSAVIDHLGMVLPLAPGEAYHYDLWTHPAARRQGLASLGTDALLHALAAEGTRVVFRAIVPENQAGIGSAHASGAVRVGTLYRVGLGPLSWRGVRRTSAPQ
jgi:GNAT superfamily N-acetyltransferase